jgi:chorismate synthase
MASNSIGNIVKLTTFGESHGQAIGGILDGFPAGLELNLDLISAEMARRKPGQSHLTTQRKEQDLPNFLSGLKNNVTTGMPIAWVIENSNQKSKDYSHLENTFRPSHADFTYQSKYGIREVSGGGRSSARETANWVVAGAICKQFLQLQNIEIVAFVKSVGEIEIPENATLDFDFIEENPLRTAHQESAVKMETYLKSIRKQGDTVGGVITGIIKNVPVGLGEPIFEKLHANLGKAFFSLNAVKGVEFGSGFHSAKMLGSQHNDILKNRDGNIITETNNAGGLLGGISNGMPINFNIAFKPVATILQKQKSVNTNGEEVVVEGKGRHDACVVPRAVPIVEALAALVIADHLLMKRLNTI